jgi:hypothetical protein
MSEKMSTDKISYIQDQLVRAARMLVSTADLVAKQHPDDMQYLADAASELCNVAELLLQTARGRDHQASAFTSGNSDGQP